MTLEQLEQLLPNGLHDAILHSFARDLVKETFVLKVGILVGLPNDPGELQNRYLDAVITFTGVKLLIVECPAASSAFFTRSSVFFSIAQSDPGVFTPEIVSHLPFETNRYSLYVLDWESCIHLTATEIAFEWA
jgi:hypothetical protein